MTQSKLEEKIEGLMQPLLMRGRFQTPEQVEIYFQASLEELAAYVREETLREIVGDLEKVPETDYPFTQVRVSVESKGVCKK